MPVSKNTSFQVNYFKVTSVLAFNNQFTSVVIFYSMKRQLILTCHTFWFNKKPEAKQCPSAKTPPSRSTLKVISVLAFNNQIRLVSFFYWNIHIFPKKHLLPGQLLGLFQFWLPGQLLVLGLFQFWLSTTKLDRQVFFTGTYMYTPQKTPPSRSTLRVISVLAFNNQIVLVSFFFWNIHVYPNTPKKSRQGQLWLFE